MEAAEGAGQDESREVALQAIEHGGEPVSSFQLGEILRFLFVGGAAAVLDLSIYLLLVLCGLPTAVSKAASFVIASVAAYFGNKHYTYSRGVRSSASVLLYMLLYACTLVINVLVNDGMLELLRIREDLETGIAWGLATAVSASLNYIGTKLLIFRGRSID